MCVLLWFVGGGSLFVVVGYGVLAIVVCCCLRLFDVVCWLLCLLCLWFVVACCL